MAEAVSISPISFLQEICIKYRLGDMPKYIDADSFGPDHCKKFSVKCIFNDRSVVAKATNKKAAKIAAASQMIIMLQDEGFFRSNQVEVDVKSLIVINGWDGAQQPTPVDELNKNPISFLQEHCLKNGMMLPLYLDNNNNNKAPFTCTCEVNGEKSQGQGSTKKRAKTNAAHNMCVMLGLITDTMINDSNISPSTQQIEKTAVSPLKELCDREPLSPQPLYGDKMSGNISIVEYTMGTRAERGEGSTKEEAKTGCQKNVICSPE